MRAASSSVDMRSRPVFRAASERRDRMSAMPSSVWRTNASRVLAVLVLAAGGTRAYAQLPDGPGKDVVVKVCGTCHEPARAAALRLTREGWEQTVADMRWRGAKGTDEEFAAVIEYLVANFLGEAPAKLNMNRATAVELESVVLLLRKEAAALIAYRDQVGGFKTIDDIKKAPGD